MRLEYFQMLDRIVDFDVDAQRIRTACTVPTESTIFEGHFPTYPLMPGVLLIECMAQTTGWLVCMLEHFSAMPFLAGVRSGKFRKLVVPGDALEFEGRVTHRGSGYAMAECVGRRDSAHICEAELMFTVRPFPNPQFREAFFALGERLNVPIKEFAK
jgi:3-hydroxyacyl-[acyl-carrier-protein] dehydratase